MPEPVIQLDRSKPFSECRGERTPDDPHYRVHFFQVYKVGRDQIQLPFDGNGELIAAPDEDADELKQALGDRKLQILSLPRVPEPPDVADAIAIAWTLATRMTHRAPR